MIILANDRTSSVAERSDQPPELWVRVGEVAQATGWGLKPEGVCFAELCVPLLPAESSAWIADVDDSVWFNYSAFADKIGQKHANDGGVWCFGAVPEVRRSGLESGIAPDFEVTERNGNTLRLSELRGRKVVLFTWASW